MKKIAAVFLVILIAIILLGNDSSKESGPDKKIDNHLDRTYLGTTYDIAFYLSEPDGLRSRAYTYYLFSKEEKKFVKFVRLTAGSGRKSVYFGTYEGSLENKIRASLEGKPSYSIVFTDDSMFDESRKKWYSSTSIEDAVSTIKRYIK